MAAHGRCHKCRRGFMVSEYSSSEKRTNYYCNYCYKYATESELGAVKLLKDLDAPCSSWGDLTDEEIDSFLSDIFKQLQD